MEEFAWLAEGFRYPTLERLESMARGIQQLGGEARQDYEEFIRQVQNLSISDWEELYNRTWDLAPYAAPYLGYQMWGDHYQRGNFMADFNQLLHEMGVDTDGELPDHIIPVLRYLAAAPSPMPALLEILPVALDRLKKGLVKADPTNPYLYLLSAFQKSLMGKI